MKSRLIRSAASCLRRAGTAALMAVLACTLAFPFGFAVAQEPAAPAVKGISSNETEDYFIAEGLGHLAAGRYAEAVALLSGASAKYPESGRIRLALGMAYSLRGGLDRLLSRSLVSTLDGQGGGLGGAEQAEPLGGTSWADLEAAQAQFLMAFQAPAPDIRGAAMYALLSAALGDAEAARDMLDLACAAAAGEPLYRAAEGFVSLSEGDLSRALDALRTGAALRRTGDFLDEFTAFYLQGGLGAALLVSSAQPGSKVAPGDALSYLAAARTSPLRLDRGFVAFAEGLAYEAMGEPGKAMEALQRAVTWDAGLSAAHEHLGFVARWIGETARARDAYRAALEWSPESIRARFGIAALESEAGDHEAAFRAYEQAFSQVPPEDRDIVLTLMAQERLAMGDPRGAMALIDEAAGLNPMSRAVAEIRGRIAQELSGAGASAGPSGQYSFVYDPVPHAKSPAVYINGDSPWVVSDEVVLDVYARYPEVSFSNDYRTWSEWKTMKGAYSRFPWALDPDVRTKRVFVKFRDASGKVFDGFPDSTEVDLEPPVGEYLINRGEQVTNKRQVLITARAQHSKGIRGFWVAAGTGSWRWLDRYFTEYPVFLTGGDGAKGITVLARSRSGLEGSFEGFVNLDTSGPLAYSVTATDVTSESAVLSWLLSEPGTAGVKVYRADERSLEVASAVSDRGPGVEHTAVVTGLSPSTTYVYNIWAEDAAQNRTVIGEFSFTTRPPDTAPPMGTVRINGGAQYTNSRVVLLEISAWDDSPGEVMMSVRDAFSDWSPWEPVPPARIWTFPVSEGVQSVWVRFRDQAGNVSEPVQAGIVVDTVSPAGSIRIRSAAGYVNNPDVWLDLAARDDRPGQVYMAFSGDGRRWTPWEPFAPTRLFRLEGLDGPKKVYVKFRDESGNESKEYADTVILDTRPPEATMVEVTEAGRDYAVISFGTSEFADSRVIYSAQGGRTQSQEGGADTLFHEVRLRGLLPDTRYSFYIECVDRAQNVFRSKVYTFKTAPAQDLTPPRISDVRVTNITETAAVVRWKTDEPATSAAVWGPAASDYVWYVGYLPHGTPKLSGAVPGFLAGLKPGGAQGEGSTGAKTVIVPNPTGGYRTDHAMTLAGLEPGTEYHFRVLSIDEKGNIAISEDYSFKTIKIVPVPSPGPVKPPSQPPATPPPADETPPSSKDINVALAANGAQARASSESGKTPDGFGPAGAAIDGNTSTAWRSEAGKGSTPSKLEWLEVRFKSTCLVRKVGIIGRAAYFPKDIVIEYLREGQWIRVYSGKTGVSGQGEGLARFSKDFNAFKAEAIRVIILKASVNDSAYEISELEAYGTIIGSK